MKRKIIAVLMAVAMTVSLAARRIADRVPVQANQMNQMKRTQMIQRIPQTGRIRKDQARQLTAAKYIISVSASWLSMKHWMQRQKALKTP